MNEKQEHYREFHRLKKEAALKLLTINDGDRLDSYADNCMEDKTNKATFDECFEMMQEAKKLADDLVTYESGEGI